MAFATENGRGALHERLRLVDSESAARIDANDVVRMVRALEVFEETGMTMTEHHRRHNHKTVSPKYPFLMIGINPGTEILYPRINERVQKMMEEGLLQEVEGLRQQGLHPESHRSQRAIGYTQLHAYLDGKIDKTEAIRLIQRDSRRYAKRQVNWYRPQTNLQWVPSPSSIDLDGVCRYLDS